MKTPSNPPSAPFLLDLRERLGEIVFCGDETLSRYSLGKLRPQAVIQPQTIAQLSTVLQMASGNHASLLFWGGGTSISLANPPNSMDLVVDTTGIDKLLSHDVDNFTVTAQAGMRLGQLQKFLKERRQFLPLDPPQAEEATLGGIVAANASGPWRLAFGSVRDLLLGIKVVLADGSTASFGGKTMKNVAGYDIGKLFIGSLGTLAAICELTFRLYSLPEESRSLMIVVPCADRAFALARKVLTWLPAAIQVLNRKAAGILSANAGLDAPGEGGLIAIDLMGDSAAVERQAKEIENACGCKIAALTGEDRLRFWEMIRLLTRASGDSTVLCRASLPPATVEEWAAAIEEVMGAHPQIFCPGTGRAWAQFQPDNQQRAAETIKALRAEAARLSGHLFVEAAPEEWKPALNLWGNPPAHLPLLKAIKESFDPAGVLSPGRFVGGI